MENLLKFLIENILGETEFHVTRTETAEGVLFEVKCTPEMMPRLIGRGGRTIKAIRDVVSIVARQEGKRVQIKLLD